MQSSTTEYEGHRIRSLEVPPNGLLLNTADILTILGQEGEMGTDLGEPSLDLAGATRLAFACNDEFGEWLVDTFAGYSLETPVRPVDWVWEN